MIPCLSWTLFQTDNGFCSFIPFHQAILYDIGGHLLARPFKKTNKNNHTIVKKKKKKILCKPEDNRASKQMFESLAHSCYPKITFANQTYPTMRPTQSHRPAAGLLRRLWRTKTQGRSSPPPDACEWTVLVSWWAEWTSDGEAWMKRLYNRKKTLTKWSDLLYFTPLWKVHSGCLYSALKFPKISCGLHGKTLVSIISGSFILTLPWDIFLRLT